MWSLKFALGMLLLRMMTYTADVEPPEWKVHWTSLPRRHRKATSVETEGVSVSDRATFHLAQESAQRASEFNAPLLSYATVNNQVSGGDLRKSDVGAGKVGGRDIYEILHFNDFVESSVIFS